MKRSSVLHNARYAGMVMRYHAWTTHQHQSVGEHTWQCLRIWCQLWGPPSPEVCAHFIWHDAGELVTGDIPFPVKSQNDLLKHTMELMETKAVLAMDGALIDLSLEDRLRAKACDLIDMHEFGRVEMLMGNKLGEPIVTDTFAALEKLKLSPEDGMLVFKYLARWEGT